MVRYFPPFGRAVFELAQSLQDSKTSDLNCSCHTRQLPTKKHLPYVKIVYLHHFHMFYHYHCLSGGCSIVGKSLCYHASDPRLIRRRFHTTRSPSHAARPTQPSIFPRSVNEYRIISGLTLVHQRRGLLPSTTTGGMTDGQVPTIPG